MKASVYVLLSSVLILTLVTSVIWWTVKRKSQKTSTSSKDEQVNEILRTLRTVQHSIQEKKRKQEKRIDTFISEKLPWLPKSNTVPNVLLQGRRRNDVVIQGSDEDKPSLVFIHHPRTAGKHVISCLNNISYSLNLAMSPMMNSKNRILWDSGNSYITTYQNRIQVHRGQFSFGMCEKLNKSCSYFTMFRDPFDSLVSHYQHCQSNTGSDICPPVDMTSKSLRQWIFEHAGLLQSQFLFLPSLCIEDSNSQHSNLTTKFYRDIPWKRVPCLHKHHLFYRNLNSTEKYYLTDYIIRNLRNWFAVIGMTDNIQDSFRTFENVFKYPFTKCDSLSLVVAKEENAIASNRAYSDNERNRILYEETDDEDDELQSLKDDASMQEALKLDYQIYNEAKRIFNMQQQVLFNRINA